MILWLGTGAFAQADDGRGAMITKQVVDFRALPNPREGQARFAPGDTVTFLYKIYTDKEAPTLYRDAKVRLGVRRFSDRFPISSLVDTSFRHLQAFRLSHTGDSSLVNFNPQLDAQQNVTYTLGDIKLDSTLVLPDSVVVTTDTLLFSFSYVVSALPDTISCIRLTGGVAAEFYARNPVTGRDQFFGENVANFEVDTESEIDWDFTLSHVDFSPLGLLNTQDSVRLTITYVNLGTVKDLARFRIFLPGAGRPGEYRDWNYRATILPDSFEGPRTLSSQRRIIEVTDLFVPPDSARHTIELIIAFDICALQDSMPMFIVALTAPCDSSAQISEEIRIPVNIALRNFLALQMTATPPAVFPGSAIDYAITVTNVDPTLALDSVRVTAILEPGIKEFREPNPTWLAVQNANQSDRDSLVWIVSLPPQGSARLTFQGVIREDFYPVVIANKDETCIVGHTRNDSARAELLGEACLESDFSDNLARVRPKINPVGDQLRVSLHLEDTATPEAILPGDLLRFIVRYENASSFAPSAWFTLTDFLPGFTCLSPPTIVQPAAARYDQAQHLITLDSLRLAPGGIDSLVFTMQVLDTCQICDVVELVNLAALNVLQGLDCDSTNNLAADTLNLGNPNTTLSLRVQLPNEANSQDVVDLLLIYATESGSLIPIQNLTVRDTLAAGMEFVSSVPAPSAIVGSELIWSNLPALTPGQSDTILVKVRLLASMACQPDTLTTRAGIVSEPAACALNLISPTATVFLSGRDDLVNLTQIEITPPLDKILDAGQQEEIEYRYSFANTGSQPADSLFITDVLPDADQFRVIETTISNPGQLSADGRRITWNFAQLDTGETIEVSFRGRLLPQLYCALDTLRNAITAVANRHLGCAADTATAAHFIGVTPVNGQPQMNLTGFSSQDANGDGVVTPNEPVTFCLNLSGNTIFEEIEFFNEIFNREGLAATVGDSAILLTPVPGNPTRLDSGSTASFCFTFQGPARIAGNSLLVAGFVRSNRNCSQAISGLVLPARGQAELVLGLELIATDSDGCVRQGKLARARMTLQHATTSAFDAENITLTLTNIGVTTGTAAVKVESPSLTTTVPQLARGEVFTFEVEFRFPDLLPSQEVAFATARYSTPAFDASGSVVTVLGPDVRNEVCLAHECYARPRTFIPAEHMQTGGLKFEPNDDLSVFILDVDGNKVWESTTRQAWYGRTNGGRDLPPGTYVWVIENECKGTIVLLR